MFPPAYFFFRLARKIFLPAYFLFLPAYFFLPPARKIFRLARKIISPAREFSPLERGRGGQVGGILNPTNLIVELRALRERLPARQVEMDALSRNPITRRGRGDHP